MPIYNTNPTFLKEAIDSILSQTYTNFEFLILNDSPNNSDLDKIITSYKDNRIRYFKNEKTLGIADAHNFLLSKAQGKYIALMDHDDISLPHRFQKQLTFLEQHSKIGLCGTACHRFGQLFKNDDIVYPEKHDEIRASLLFRCPILHPTIMFRNSLLKKHNIKWNNRFISLNDRKLYLDISEHTQLENLPDILYRYRLSPSMTSKVKRKQIENEQKEFRQICLDKLQIKLNSDEMDILNNYILKGRCRIKDKHILEQVFKIIHKLDEANQKTNLFNTKEFKKICARYLIKRCKNAAFYGRIPCSGILKQTHLPVKIPTLLKIYTKLERLF